MSRFNIALNKLPKEDIPKSPIDLKTSDATGVGLILSQDKVTVNAPSDIPLNISDTFDAMVVTQRMEAILTVQPGQRIEAGSFVGMDGSGTVIPTTDGNHIGIALQSSFPQLSHRGTLHEHPGLQQRLGVDSSHVIVDRRDWGRARSLLSQGPENHQVRTLLTDIIL